jgi:CDGSH-type Zn-finger protein
VVNAEGEQLFQGDDVALCRCGASANKPFCDGSHRETEFVDEGVVHHLESDEPGDDGPLIITVRDNAMLIARGPVEIANADNTVAAVRSKAAFCRCGASGNKPLCDGNHKVCGFSG